jgi:hypothetical protein
MKLLKRGSKTYCPLMLSGPLVGNSMSQCSIQTGCEVTPLSLRQGGASVPQIVVPVANSTKKYCLNDRATDVRLYYLRNDTTLIVGKLLFQFV